MNDRRFLQSLRALNFGVQSGTERRSPCTPSTVVSPPSILENRSSARHTRSTWRYVCRDSVTSLSSSSRLDGGVASSDSSGMDSAPERGKRTSWSEFLRAHWGAVAAMDFITVEAVDLGRVGALPRLVRDRPGEPVRGGRRHRSPTARNHRGVDHALITPTNDNAAASGRVVRRQRLGGVLSFSHHEAA